VPGFLWFACNLVQWLFIAAWTVLWTSVAVLLSAITGRRGLGLTMARRIWAPAIVRGAGGRLEAVLGTERLAARRAYFFACNHQSFGDIPVLFWSLPVNVRFVAKQELRGVPFLGWYMQAMGMVFVDRKRKRSGAQSIDAAALLLRQGQSVLSFPGGTRRPGARQAWKPAALAAALTSGAPIVPVAVHGTSSVLPAGRPRLRPAPIRVMIGEPIETTGLTLADREAVTRQAEEAVQAMLTQLAAEAADAAHAAVRAVEPA
jgi:1-acyl-sn-glycerol-3-phosphate acyltransferase